MNENLEIKRLEAENERLRLELDELKAKNKAEQAAGESRAAKYLREQHDFKALFMKAAWVIAMRQMNMANLKSEDLASVDKAHDEIMDLFLKIRRSQVEANLKNFSESKTGYNAVCTQLRALLQPGNENRIVDLDCEQKIINNFRPSHVKGQKIISIQQGEWMFGTDFNYPPQEKQGRGYDGYAISLDDGTHILVGVDNRPECCENWGYLEIDKDEIEHFIGAYVNDVCVVDNNLVKTSKVFSEVQDVSQVMFVELQTSKGTLTIAVYNSHNGYYGHDAVLVWRGEKLKEIVL